MTERSGCQSPPHPPTSPITKVANAAYHSGGRKEKYPNKYPSLKVHVTRGDSCQRKTLGGYETHNKSSLCS